MRTLVIEDYPPLRTAIAAALKGAGFAVDASGDGAEGDWLATSSDYDDVILDLGLPQLDGLELLRRMRARGSQAHVLIVTARDQVDDRCAGLDAGADDYLVKPFAIPELLARVRALLRRAYQRKDPVVRIADLEVDTARRAVRRAGREVQLTPREYALLAGLALGAAAVLAWVDLRLLGPWLAACLLVMVMVLVLVRRNRGVPAAAKAARLAAASEQRRQALLTAAPPPARRWR